MKDTNRIILFFLILVICGCRSPQIVDSSFLNPQHFYKITLPGAPWEKVSIHDADIAMRNRENNSMFVIMSHPVNNERTTLDTLYRQLFIGMQRKSIVNRQYVYVGNQRVLHVVLEGELDNADVKISAYIINANNLVHDVVYWSIPAHFDNFLADFEKVVESFKFTGLNEKVSGPPEAG